MCKFCDLENIQYLKVAETHHSLVICSLYPISILGHFLVIPKRHVVSISDLSEEQLNDLSTLVFEFMKRVKTLIKPEGINVLVNEGEVAGQTMEHLHVHIICRAAEDGIKNFNKDTGKVKISPDEVENFKMTLG